MRRKSTLSLVALLAMFCLNPFLSVSAYAAVTAEPIVVKVSIDHGGTQASSYCEMALLRDAIQKRIPGSEVRLFHSSSLYKPVETMNQLANGNLEMAIQDGDASGWDAWVNMQVWPMSLPTVGCHAEFAKTRLASLISERFDDRGVKVFGFNHQSTYGGLFSPKRMLTLDDVKGKKIRVSGILTQGPMVESWGAVPIAMGWGDVPSALQSGVIDGALSTVGAWRSVQDIAPFYTALGIGGVFQDFDIVCVSKKWWNSLSMAQRVILEEILDEFVGEFANWQNTEDQLGYKDYGTKDPNKPGIYIATAEQIAPFREGVAKKIFETLVNKLGEEVRPIGEQYLEDSKQLAEMWPAGSHPCENIDFEAYRSKIHMDKK